MTDKKRKEEVRAALEVLSVVRHKDLPGDHPVTGLGLLLVALLQEHDQVLAFADDDGGIHFVYDAEIRDHLPTTGAE